jgi:hypothetical protein
MGRKEQLRTEDEMVSEMTQILKKQYPNLISIKNNSIHKVRSMSILNDEFTRHYNIKELTIDILIELADFQHYKLEP